MPQLSPIVINDDNGIAHTYTPASVNDRNGMSTLVESSQSQRNLAEKLTVSLVPLKNNNGHLVELRLNIPNVVTDANTGITSVLESDTAIVSITSRKHSDGPRRQTLRSLVLAALQDATITAMFDDLEQTW